MQDRSPEAARQERYEIKAANLCEQLYREFQEIAARDPAFVEHKKVEKLAAAAEWTDDTYTTYKADLHAMHIAEGNVYQGEAYRLSFTASRDTCYLPDKAKAHENYQDSLSEAEGGEVTASSYTYAINFDFTHDGAFEWEETEQYDVYAPAEGAADEEADIIELGFHRSSSSRMQQSAGHNLNDAGLLQFEFEMAVAEQLVYLEFARQLFGVLQFEDTGKLKLSRIFPQAILKEMRPR